MPAQDSKPSVAVRLTDEELTEIARRGRDLCNHFLMQNRALQAEAYASYCKREALVEAEERACQVSVLDPEDP